MSKQEFCPVCCTADIICGKWTLLIIRDLADGPLRFCELERSLVGISPRTLSVRLRVLEEEEILIRRSYAEAPPRVEYVLTEKGRDLIPIIDGMRSYGMRWLGDGNLLMACDRGEGAYRNEESDGMFDIRLDPLRNS